MSDADSGRVAAGSSERSPQDNASERVISARCDPLPADVAGVDFRLFASSQCGARDISTGTATFQPGAGLPCHRHSFSEAVTVLAGEASCSVEGRTYRLRLFDCIHIPAGTAHETRNASLQDPLVALWAFATGAPSRELVLQVFPMVDRGWGHPEEGEPEHLVRFRQAPRFPLASGMQFCDLFAKRFGAIGMQGGYGEFDPGSSLSYRVHDFDESVTIVAGEAVCEVAGGRYRLSGCDTLFVPRGREHRFFNDSDSPMAMIWVRAART